MGVLSPKKKFTHWNETVFNLCNSAAIKFYKFVKTDIMEVLGDQLFKRHEKRWMHRSELCKFHLRNVLEWLYCIYWLCEVLQWLLWGFPSSLSRMIILFLECIRVAILFLIGYMYCCIGFFANFLPVRVRWVSCLLRNKCIGRHVSCSHMITPFIILFKPGRSSQVSEVV